MDSQQVLEGLRKRLVGDAEWLCTIQNENGSFPDSHQTSSVDATVGALEFLGFVNGRIESDKVPKAVKGAEDFLTRSFWTREGRRNYWTKIDDDPKTVADIAYVLPNNSEISGNAYSILVGFNDWKLVRERSVMMQNEVMYQLSALRLLGATGKKNTPLRRRIMKELFTHQKADGGIDAVTCLGSLTYFAYVGTGGFRRDLTAAFVTTLHDNLKFSRNTAWSETTWGGKRDKRRRIAEAAHYLFEPNSSARFYNFIFNPLYLRAYRSTPLAVLDAYMSYHRGLHVGNLPSSAIKLLDAVCTPPPGNKYRLREAELLLSIRKRLNTI